MMLALFVDCYANGIFSSRRIEVYLPVTSADGNQHRRYNFRPPQEKKTPAVREGYLPLVWRRCLANGSLCQERRGPQRGKSAPELRPESATVEYKHGKEESHKPLWPMAF